MQHSKEQAKRELRMRITNAKAEGRGRETGERKGSRQSKTGGGMSIASRRGKEKNREVTAVA